MLKGLGTLLALGLLALPGSSAAEGEGSTLRVQSQQSTLPDVSGPQGRDFVRTAFRSTAIALVHQPVTTARLGKAMFWRRSRSLVEDNLPIPLALPQAQPPRPGSPEFESHLDRLGLPAAIAGELDYFVGGDAFFSEFERQIAGARQSIDLQVFIFDNDDVSVRYADLLRARSTALPVRVLIDDLGSTFAHGRVPPGGLPPGFVQPKDIGTYLTDRSEVQFRQTLNPWLITDHTKLIVFDRETAFLGGMNIGRESRHAWHDLMVRVRGPIVAPLADRFDRTWEQAGPRGDFALLDPVAAFANPDDAAELPTMRILRTDLANGRSDILLAMLHALRGARERIWIETPYFSADAVVHEMKAAAARGVDVRLILPQRANHGIMDAANLATASTLLDAGVRVYRYPGMTHLKAMVCDDWATVGAANLDTISLRINRELNLSFSDRALVEDLVDSVFQPDFEAATPMRQGEAKVPLGLLLEMIADQL